MKNSDLETMRTPAVHKGSSTVGTFEKIEPNFTFWKTAKSHATILLKSSPTCEEFIRLFVWRKNEVWAPHLDSDRSKLKTLKKNRPRPAGLSLGRTPLQAVVLPLKAIWRSSSQSFFTTLLMKSSTRNNNCAAACMRTVEVLARLIGTLRRCGGRG